MSYFTLLLTLLPTLVFSQLSSPSGCHLVDNLSHLESSVICLNLTLDSALLKPDPPETAESIFKMPNLIIHLVNGSIDNGTFKYFSNLRSLRISECHLEKIEPLLDTLEALRLIDSEATVETFGRISRNLQKLTIRNSTGFAFTSSTFNQLKQLRSLHLSHLNISTLPNSIFRDLTSLKILRIQEINLEKIDEEAFAGLGRLKELYLEDNNLEHLSGDIFKPLKKLRSLVISGKRLKALALDMFSEQKYLNQLSWPASTWRAIDIDRVPRLFPRLYSISHYSSDEQILDVSRKIRVLNAVIMNRNN